MQITMTKLPWYAQIGAFIVLSLAGIGAYYYYYEAGVRADMATRRMQLVSLRAEIAKGYATAKQLPQFRAQVAELQGRLNNLKAVLPEEKDAADLLRRLQTLATQSNLTIKGFKPSPIITKQIHAEWPIALEFDGTYHNLANFFDRVGKVTRIINISELDVNAKDKPSPSSTITAKCVATTFVLLDKPAAPKTPAGKPAPAAGRGA